MYGGGVNRACHYCDNATAYLLVTIGAILSLVLTLLLLLAVVVSIGDLDAIENIRERFSRKISCESNAPARVVPLPQASQEKQTNYDPLQQYTRSYARTETPERGPRDSLRGPNVFAPCDARGLAVASIDIGRAPANTMVVGEAGGRGGNSKGCGLGDKFKYWVSKFPFDKLKLLVVVWQILTVFSKLSGVDYPVSYSRFLLWVNVVNLNIGDIASAACILSSENFYPGLVLTTLAPRVLISVLLLEYKIEKNRAGIGSDGVISKRASWSS